MKLLEVTNLSKSFKDFQAVKNLSFTINQGDVYGFLGPNGAGKSTTLRMILGLIYPTGGSIVFNGEPIAKNNRDYLNQIGALIERPDFHTNLTAYQNLKLFARISNIDAIENRIQEVLNEVKLSDRQHSKVKSFSQGMKQRLGIAQAILHKPKLIILDEPSNGLDPQGQADMRDLIKRINQEMQITVIISSHILSEIELIANRMIIIANGEKIQEGNVNELMSSEQMKIEIKTSDLDKAVQLLKLENYNYQLNNNKLIVSCEENHIPVLNKKLLDAGVNIFEMKQLRTLEEHFLKLTA